MTSDEWRRNDREGGEACRRSLAVPLFHHPVVPRGQRRQFGLSGLVEFARDARFTATPVEECPYGTRFAAAGSDLSALHGGMAGGVEKNGGMTCGRSQ